MKELYPLSGVVAIPQTPFDDDDRIDLDSFARGVADRLAAGVDGLLYPVVASEVSRLTDRERRTLTLAVLEQAAARVPVFVGASADDVADVRALAEFATMHGAAGVLVQAPVALLRDEAATVAFFRAVCEAPIEVLMIQDLEWGGPGLPVATIARLFEELEPFRCIKVETVPAGQQVHGDPRGDRRAAERRRRLGGPVPDRGARPRDPRRDAGRPALGHRGGRSGAIARAMRTARGPCSTASCRSSAGRTSTSTSRTSS